MQKPINRYEKALHELDLKLTRSTCYDPNRKMTLKRLLVKVIKNIHYPIKKRTGIGYCDLCGKFSTGLDNVVIDNDFDYEDGETLVYRVYGLCCEKCQDELESVTEERER